LTCDGTGLPSALNASTAPYFANGSAANLRELVDFYDRRFNIQYTEQEKQDLVNFLSVL